MLHWTSVLFFLLATYMLTFCVINVVLSPTVVLYLLSPRSICHSIVIRGFGTCFQITPALTAFLGFFFYLLLPAFLFSFLFPLTQPVEAMAYTTEDGKNEICSEYIFFLQKPKFWIKMLYQTDLSKSYNAIVVNTKKEKNIIEICHCPCITVTVQINQHRKSLSLNSKRFDELVMMPHSNNQCD